MNEPPGLYTTVSEKIARIGAFFEVLGVRVDAVQIPDVISQMQTWIASTSVGRFIAVTGMHGVVEAEHNPSFKEILNGAALVVPDGMPLVWLGRWRGHGLKRRVYGPELMETFCRLTGPKYRHFFYGGAPGVAERLADILKEKYGLIVAGTYSPPYRDSIGVDENEVALIRAARPDVVWVGLGTPKQERWIHCHRALLDVPVLVSVGAAFDFLTGGVKQAPLWMQENGLECLFRLCQEPLRLWKRYLVKGSEFVWKVSLEAIGLKKFQ